MPVSSTSDSSKSSVTRQHSKSGNDSAEKTSAGKGLGMTKAGPHEGFLSGMAVQAKLKMGASNDRYEREADNIADKVTEKSGDKHVQAVPLASTVTPLVQRQEDDKDEETAQAKEDDEKEESAQAKGDDKDEETQAKEDDEKEESAQAMALPGKEQEKELKKEEQKGKVMRKATAKAPKVVRSDIASRIKRSRGTGQQLPGETKRFMESRFGTDFGKVNIHTDTNAADLSKSLNAKAFTVGKDIFFNQGKFDPSSTEGKKLLAHELTHTIQQGAVEARPQEKPAPPAAEKKTESEKEQEKVSPPEKDKQNKIAATDVTAATEKAAPLKEEDAAKLTQAPGSESAESTETAAKGSKEKKSSKEEIPAKEEAGPEKKEGHAGAGHAKEGPASKKKQGGAESKKGADGAGNVAAYLKKKGEPAVQKGKAGITKLSKNMQKHESGAAKTTQAVKAVEPPSIEGDSKGKAQQVEAVEKNTPPPPDDQQAKTTLTATVEQNVPQSLKEVDNFKKSGKGKVAGEAVLGDVKSQTESVKSNYTGISDAKPVPSTETPEALPEVEKTEDPGKLGLGANTVPALKKEHTDLTEYSQQSDELVEKEGITEEQLEMVDEGDLAEAKKVKGEVKEKTKSEPEAVRNFAEAESTSVTKTLEKEEKDEKAAMKAKRTEALNATKKKQEGTKTGIEKKREDVALKINGIYQRAKDKVTTRLNDLEKSSLKKFDDGQAAASVTFEDSVKRDIDAYKKKRYSGTFGWAKKAKDWLMGIDDHPEVKDAFDRARSTFVSSVQILVDTITAENKKVIQECKDELAAAKKEIADFVKKLGPELREAGQTAMNEMNSKLAELDTMVNKKEQELQEKLKEKQEKAIKAIDEKIAKMKEAMSGALSKLGNLLLEAAKKFFRWALRKIGAPVDKIMGILEKGAVVIKEIVTSPIKFIGNLVKGVKGGISGFSDRIKQHLINGLMGWLVGPLAEGGVTLPQTFDLKGAFSLVMQVLGLTYQNIRKMIAKRVGDPLMAKIEQGVDIVTKLVKEGPVALWEQAKESLGDIKETILSEIRNWVAVEIVKQAIVQLISFLNPAGAVFQAIKAIYNIVMFFIERWDQIVEFVGAVFDSISEIAMGNIGKAAGAVEKALAKSIPVIISFLARLIGLGGVGQKVRQIFDKIRKPIEKVLAKVVDFVVKKAKALFSKIAGGFKSLKKKGKEKLKQLVEWWKVKKTFKAADDKTHTLYYKGKGSSASLMVASTPMTIPEFLSKVNGEIDKLPDEEKKKQAKANHSKASSSYTAIESTKNQIAQQKDLSIQQKLQKKIKDEMAVLSHSMASLVGLSGDKYPPAVLPPMMNGVKAKSFKAEYLGPDLKDGTEAGSYDGKTLIGWKELQASGLTAKSSYVKMHLLPHRLGGDAVDSNLVPASGPDVNIPFSHAIEKEAIAERKDNKGTVWYDIIVKFHPGDDHGYPKEIIASWGTYEKKGTSFKRVTKRTHPSGAIAIPSTNASLNINTAGVTRIAAFLGIEESFAAIITKIRDENNIKFKDANHIESEIYKRQLRNMESKYTLVKDWEAKVDKLSAVLQQKKSKIIF
jgi:phage-related protein